MKNQKSWPIKKTFLFSLKASMTVEAAIVVPLFLIFFINLSASIEMIRLHGNISMALWDTGNKMAYYGSFLTKEESSESNKLLQEIGDLALSYTYVKGQLVDYLGKDYLNSSPLVQGDSGFSFWESEILTDNDQIDIVVTYPVSTPIDMGGLVRFRMANRYYSHLWNGYDVGEGNSETEKKNRLVFITKDSEVYHRRTSCTYLRLSVRVSNSEKLSSERNADGGKYSRCLLCARGSRPDTVYLCDDGSKYHYDRECFSLRRSFSVVTLSSVSFTHRPCSRCGE